MSWSMNEIDGLARKAVRGAGYSWGLAEEAGKAVRWLTSFSLPGPEMLAAHLPKVDGVAYADLCPALSLGVWRAAGGTLCPLATGPALMDRSGAASDEGVTLGAIACPLLILPSVASVAVLTGQAMMLDWDGFRAIVAPGRQLEIAESDGMQALMVETVTIGPSNTPPVPNCASVYRYALDPAVAASLGGFAHRTYAPDTEESRLAGAGAGLTDND